METIEGVIAMNKYSRILLRFSAIFALVGVFLGSHMAGDGNYAFKSTHAHILVVGWLSLFAWAIFYKIFRPDNKILAIIHVWTAITGSIGLTVGMWFRYIGPFGIDTNGIFSLLFFIIGGTILLISFAVFCLLTFMKIDNNQ